MIPSGLVGRADAICIPESMAIASILIIVAPTMFATGVVVWPAVRQVWNKGWRLRTAEEGWRCWHSEEEVIAIQPF